MQGLGSHSISFDVSIKLFVFLVRFGKDQALLLSIAGVPSTSPLSG